MKRIACLLVAMLFATLFGQAQTDVVVGEDGNNYTDYFPFYFHDPYSYSQTVYLAEELLPGTITSISYYTEFNNTISDAPVALYLGEVARTQFYGGSGSTDFVPADSLTQVFSGNVTFAESGWVTITFDTPFVFSGNNNLVVAAVHTRGVGAGYGYDYKSKMFPIHRSIISSSETSAIGPQVPVDPINGASMSYEHIPISKFNITLDEGFCLPVSNLTTINTTENTATVAWSSNGSANAYTIEYQLATESTTWTVAGTTADTSFVITELESQTEYRIRVIANCISSDSPERTVTALTTPPSLSNMYNVPFEEDFDAIPDNWVFANGTQNNWFIGSAANHTVDSDGLLTTNGKALYVSNDGGLNLGYTTSSTDNSCVYANVYFPNAQTFELSFDWKCVGDGYYDAFHAYLAPLETEITASYDNYSHQILDYTSGSQDWQTKRIELPGTYQGAYKLVFRWKNDYSGGTSPAAVIDNLAIRAFNCAAITSVVVTPATVDGVAVADVVITDNNNTDATYLIQYRPAGTAEAWSIVESATTTAQITGLTFSTEYELQVIAVCDGGDQSMASESVIFRTSCGLISTLPWSENFAETEAPSNTIGNENAPACWYNINAGEGSGAQRFSYSNGSAYFVGGTVSSPRYYSEWLISPMLNLTGNERLNFNLKQPYTDMPVKFEVRVFDASSGDMTSAADTSSFELLESIELFTASSSYMPYELGLGQYNGPVRIAFAVREQSDYFNIDDVSVSLMSECPDMYNVSVTPISSTSVNVHFSTSNGTNNGWVVAYGQADTVTNFNPATATQISVASASSVPVLIDNLTTGQNYFFAVKHNCSTAMYSTPVSIVVPSVLPLPYNQNFDNTTTASADFTTSWSSSTGSENRWYIGTAVNNTTDASGSLTDGGAMYISKDGGVSNEYNNNGANIEAFSTAIIGFGAGNSFSLDFDWRAVGESNSSGTSQYDYLRVYMIPASMDIVLSDAFAITPKLNAQSTWQHESVTLSADYANTVQKLVFYWKNDGSDGTNPPAAVDNITMLSSNCGLIEQVNLVFQENGNEGEIVVSVVDNNENATYIVEYREQGAANYTTVNNVTFPYSIPANYTTTYEVRVAAVCGEEQTGFTQASITTPCQSMIPEWMETFDTNPFNTSCWLNKSGMLPSSGNISTTSLSNYNAWLFNTHTELNGVVSNKIYSNIYSNNQKWAITPSVNLGDGSTIYQISVDVAILEYNGGVPESAPDDKFAILVSTDNGATWNAANGLIFADGDADTEHNYSDFGQTPTRVVYKLVDASNNPYTGVVKFAFYGESTQSNGDNNIFIDNLSVSEWGACQKPYSLAVSQITSSSASISFQSVEPTATFEYALQTTASPIALATNSIELTDLTPLTEYTFFVRSVCGENSTSAWDSITFKTYPTVAELPYANSFAIATDAEQWVSLSGSANAWAVGTATVSDLDAEQMVEGDMAAYISTDEGQTYSANTQSTYAYFFKDFDFAEGDAVYTLSFDYKVKGKLNSSGTPIAGLNVYLQDMNTPLNTTALPSNTADLIATYTGQETWANATFELPYVSGEKRLVFLTWGYEQSGAASVPAAIDNIEIAESFCPKPQDLHTTAITSSTIAVMWVGFSESYQVTCTPTNSTESITLTTTDDYVTFTELTSAQEYVIKVQGICGDEFSVISDSIVAKTTCVDGAITVFPYEEGFESGVDCWTQTEPTIEGVSWYQEDEYQYSYSGFIYAQEGSSFAYIYPHNDYGYGYDSVMLISNIMDLTILDTPRLSFYHLQRQPNWYNDFMRVYYRTSPESAWVELATYTEEIENWRMDSVNLPNATTTYQIAFKAVGWGGDGVLLDNVRVYEANPNAAPCDAPTALTVSNVTASSAEVSWTGTSTSYEIRLSGEAVEIETIEPLTASTKTFTDLMAGFTYTVSVRGVCEGTRSQWTTTTFTTTAPIVAPVVTTLAATEVTHESAVLNGTITAGSEEITAQGFMYKATAAADWTTVAATSETITASVEGLTAETEYTFKAFATTASGTVEGTAMTFTTTAAPIVAPVVTTLAATEITNATAKLNGTVTAGSEEIVAQGFMYKASNAADWTTVAAVGETMTLTVEGLEAELEYVFKAFATTASGTTEGEELTFTTLSGLNDATAVSIIASVYPNPAEDKATISVSGLMNATKIVVSDMQGRILLSDDMNESTYELNTSNYASGVYYIRIISGNAVNTQKLIVK